MFFEKRGHRGELFRLVFLDPGSQEPSFQNPVQEAVGGGGGLRREIRPPGLKIFPDVSTSHTVC